MLWRCDYIWAKIEGDEWLCSGCYVIILSCFLGVFGVVFGWRFLDCACVGA